MWLLWASSSSRFFFSNILLCLNQPTHLKEYSLKCLYWCDVFFGGSTQHDVWRTWGPLCVTRGGITCPHAFAKVSIVLVLLSSLWRSLSLCLFSLYSNHFIFFWNVLYPKLIAIPNIQCQIYLMFCADLLVLGEEIFNSHRVGTHSAIDWCIFCLFRFQ